MAGQIVNQCLYNEPHIRRHEMAEPLPDSDLIMNSHSGSARSDSARFALFFLFLSTIGCPAHALRNPLKLINLSSFLSSLTPSYSLLTVNANMSSPTPTLNEKSTIPFWGTGKRELTYIYKGCPIATAARGSECLFFEPKQYTVAVKASSIKVRPKLPVHRLPTHHANYNRCSSMHPGRNRRP